MLCILSSHSIDIEGSERAQEARARATRKPFGSTIFGTHSWPECGCLSRHTWRHDICTQAFAHAASHTPHIRGRPPKMAQSSPPMRLIELCTHSCRCGDSPPPLDNLPGARAPLASAWDKDRRQRMRLRGVAAATAGGVLSASRRPRPGLCRRQLGGLGGCLRAQGRPPQCGRRRRVQTGGCQL